MIGVLTDIIQSLSICILAVTLILLTRRVNRQPAVIVPQVPYKEPEPICGCTHHHCFHDDNGCGQKAVRYDGTMVIACGCKRYTGPEPLPQVIP